MIFSGKSIQIIPDLSLATEEQWIDTIIKLQSYFEPGAISVQLRIPGASARQLLHWGETLQKKISQASLIINDRLDVAAALKARAVHLGRGSVGVGEARALLGHDLWVSRACHDTKELEQAAREGANAALLSPVFSSPGKGEPLGLDMLRAACFAFPTLSIIALGGVQADNIKACFAAGASGVAMIRSALFSDSWNHLDLRLLSNNRLKIR